MTHAKAMILGCSGPALTLDEQAFFREHQPWGFILFGRNCLDGAQISDLVAQMRDTVAGRNAPVLIDQEGGRVQRIREPMCPRYPSGAEIGALYRQDEEKGIRAAWLMSRLHAFDLMRYGINVDCLPVVDVPVEGASNVIGNRAYGFDPDTVGALGEAAAAGLKAGGVLPTVKHIPGHGRGMADSHHELPVVTASRAELEAHDFPPFQRLNGELMAMTAHVVYSAYDPDYTASTSSIVVDEVIRGLIGFQGLLMNDDLSMNALKGTISERAAAVIAAGNDVLLHCHGIMEEMVQVAERAPVLAGAALARVKAVEAAFGGNDGADEQVIRAEFASLMAVA
ncbi:beta-N-acetylhexosaminidase [Agrobacterium vitis]|uniref:beta-N-acetylhexosaminidase n=1 Tax=Agrobacterium vitis TaxID=373 RepID=A0ABD6G6R9_AGRVI|nr:beta-N-acetylhexosaminidase [Agrobacterium vitis]MUO77866.1 beta-N-acetylhexosaminidase [Agrobacterium vitis]MUO93384.1 beta-N-acetylhexosaminidase [Agrobacterium vitis]MUP04735.1 beta-N-acetylhexosaminidase [Agrobacterium vitis]MUZ80828.1 beta-N-acetylhexosaminidase [Agrobacterium vitis]MVA08987.1 beta-N-acetylhexosaminidase [Agrobacterium vitis]